MYLGEGISVLFSVNLWYISHKPIESYLWTSYGQQKFHKVGWVGREEEADLRGVKKGNNYNQNIFVQILIELMIKDQVIFSQNNRKCF